MHKIFIDGQAGTTGLKIHQYLQGRGDLALLEIADEDRKNDAVKYDLVSEADVVIMCLPDEAAKKTVKLAANAPARMIDASTAHRVDPDWTYGLPELSPGQRKDIQRAKFVSNPGCYPTGFLLAVSPLTRGGLLDSQVVLTISAVSGYTGGGRQMIERYEERATNQPDQLWYSRPYALSMNHKHVPEMTHFAGLAHSPLFLPSVGHYPQGMLVSIPLAASWFAKKMSPDNVASLLAEAYADESCVVVHDANDESELEYGQLEPQTNNGTNRVDLFTFGNDEQILLIARLDNLGKGAAGAAVQNLNLMLGIDELSGLSV
jgi:N-acetyl-gamma-glutamyl-phosphate reductase